MNTCDLPAATATLPAETAAPTSRIMRFRSARGNGEANAWEGVEPTAYKPAAGHHCGVVRNTLIGEKGERTAFHVRYFEVAPAGRTSLERHQHEHAVIVLRGRGEIRLGDVVHSLAYGDTLYVAPNEIHQLSNPSEDEPFGFFCMVDARRDTAAPV